MRRQPGDIMNDGRLVRYLTGYATARWLVQSEGLGDDANAIVPLIQRPPVRADAIVLREAHLLVLKLLRWLRTGQLNPARIEPDQLAELFGISVEALRELESKLK